MFLSKLKIIGFKSFAFKTHVDFKEGITAIIGPNGCGKSNIVDAIRWVLGEQKYSALRSSKMEDVIFNGTTKYPPKNVAEVSIHIENNKNILPMEYDEVSITRRLFRSGDSEYLLNGVKCRLRDIVDLFLDTGMGSHAYSIIEQQMIHALLSDKKDDRKNIFDEAAGIMKYKDRKKEAIRKLKANEGDLARVNDLIIEIEKNVRSLKRQANKAERFIRIQKEKDEKEVFFYQLNLHLIETYLQPLRDELNGFNDEKQKLVTSINKNEADVQAIVKDSLDKNNDFQKIQKNCQEKNRKKHEYKQEITLLNERKKQLAEQVLSRKNENKELNTRVDSLIEEIKSKQKEIVRLDEEYLTDKDRYEEIKKNISSKEEQLKVLEKEKKESEKSLWENQRNHETILRKTQLLEERLNWLKKESSDLEKQEKSLKENQREQKEKLNKINEEKNRLLLKNEEIEEDLYRYEYAAKEIMDEKKEALDKKDSIQRQIAKLSDRYEILNSMSVEDSLDSDEEKKWTRFFKENDMEFIDLYDYINPKQGYGQGLTWLLLNYLKSRFYLPYPSRDIIQYNQQPFGLFRFFNDFGPKNENIGPPCSNMTAFIDLLEINEEYHDVICEILSFCFYCEDINEVDLDSIKGPFVLIDSQGVIYDFKNKIIQIGQTNKKDSELKYLFGKKKKLEELKEELSKKKEESHIIEEEFKRIEQKLDSAKNRMKIINEEKDKIRERLREVSNRKNRVDMESEHVQREMNKICDKLSENRDKYDKGNSDIQREKKQLEFYANENGKLEEELKKRISAYDEYYQSISRFQEDKNKIQLEMVEKKSKLEIAKEGARQKDYSIQEVRERLKKNEKTSDEMLSSINEIEKKLKNSDQVLFEISKDLDKEYKKREALDRAIEGYNKLRDEKGNELKQLRKKLDNNQILIDETKEKVFKHEKNYEVFKNKLLEKNGLESIESFTLPDEEMNMELLENQVVELNNKLSLMGNVNFEAIEEYEEQKQRFDFYVQQKEDLIKAKDLLLSTIKDINKTAEDMYLKTFSQVKENFKKIFTGLFEGGDCDLILEKNPDDPLDMDVSILARPKGKRIQHISLLSGGEKALTSIALLFAIYLVKPSPYCILDELDAPLDDANVGRYLKLLRDFTSDTQFILITHNKNTMEAADVLYGVTMEEAGVSKLVSVDFSGQGVKR